MANDSGLPANHDPFTNPHATCNPGLGRDDRVFSDNHVMRYLHQVIDLRSRLNPSATKTRPIDRRVRADFHVVVDLYYTDLRHFLLTLRCHFESKSIRTDDSAAVQNHTRPEPATLPDYNPRINRAAVTDHYVVPNVTTRTDG